MSNNTQSYNLYRSLTNPFDEYRPGDRLWFDSTSYEAPALPDPEVLNWVFRRHNRDDRPDGQLAPSLSVGDVIVLDFADERCRFYAVDIEGFREVEGPYLHDVDPAERWSDAPITRRAS